MNHVLSQVEGADERGENKETRFLQENGFLDAVSCPFCESTETEMIALFGQQMMTSQYYCRNCHSAFEAVKWEDTESKE
jgi:ring-1,2-phenylacetyl-CoA epoxidase subunit PaaD